MIFSMAFGLYPSRCFRAGFPHLREAGYDHLRNSFSKNERLV